MSTQYQSNYCRLGYSDVKLSGNQIIAGFGPTYANTGVSGAIACFSEQTNGTWNEDVIPYPGSDSGYRFPTSIDFDGDILIAGEPDRYTSDSEGRLYFYEKVGNQWTLRNTVVNPAPTNVPSSSSNRDGFAAHIAISGNSVIASAPGQDTQGPSAGRLYDYTVIPRAKASDEVWVTVGGDTTTGGNPTVGNLRWAMNELAKPSVVSKIIVNRSIGKINSSLDWSSTKRLQVMSSSGVDSHVIDGSNLSLGQPILNITGGSWSDLYDLRLDGGNSAAGILIDVPVGRLGLVRHMMDNLDLGQLEGYGIQVTDHSPSTVALIGSQIHCSEVGLINNDDLKGKGLSFDEEGDGSAIVSITQSTFSDCGDDGFQVCEHGAGSVMVTLNSTVIDSNGEDGVDIDEFDAGNITLSATGTMVRNNSSAGIDASEELEEDSNGNPVQNPAEQTGTLTATLDSCVVTANTDHGAKFRSFYGGDTVVIQNGSTLSANTRDGLSFKTAHPGSDDGTPAQVRVLQSFCQNNGDNGIDVNTTSGGSVGVLEIQGLLPDYQGNTNDDVEVDFTEFTRVGLAVPLTE